MSVSGIPNSSLFELIQAEKSQTRSSQASAFQKVGHEFSQLGQDLQAGNLTQAQQDFGTLSQALQSAGQGQHFHAHHHHHGGENSQQASAIQQDFNSLGQALQSGDLNGAQTAFAQLQQDLGNFSSGGLSSSSSADSSSSSNSSSTTGTTLNVTA